MTTISNDLMSAVNGASAAGASTSSLTDNSPKAIQDRFLKLLMVQMKNQDPNNPMDNSQLTSQMAQLSTVTGISTLNASLNTLMSNLQSTQSLQAASMIGHSVLAPGNTLQLASTTTKDANGVSTTTQKSVFGLQLANDADAVNVTIKDSSGNVVRKLSLGAQSSGVVPVIWDGTNDAGKKAADGDYTFTVSATVGKAAVSATPLAFGTVSSVMNGADGIKLNVSNIGTIKQTDVVQIL